MKARDTFQRFGWGSQGRSRRHPLIAGILVLVLVAQVGCASSGTPGKFIRMSTHDIWSHAPEEPGVTAQHKALADLSAVVPPLPGEAVHLAFGNMGVTSARFAPRFEYKVAVGSSGFVMDEDDPSKGTAH
ncbi:hypothetical protein [Candidatus Methylomirabilis sp.]|uniref:hypothetical protein n=1 Tax=Candidatus Methylomirabilis sp. TaxID=2032687 RepID=UPI0030762D3E